MTDKPAGKVTEGQTASDQNDAVVTPSVAASGRDTDGQHDAQRTQDGARQPKHDVFDWVNLVILVFTFLAAGGAAYEAKRLANGTDQLIADGQKAALEQATLSRASMDLSRQTLIATQRPWIAADIKLSGPLTYESDGAHIQVSADLHNTGQSPALNVFILWRAGTSVTEETFKDQRDLCERARQFRRRGGDTLLPGDKINQEGTLIIPKATLSNAAGAKGYYAAHVYGCVDYLSTLDESHHQTGFILELLAKQLDSRGTWSLNVNSGNMGVEDLGLVNLFGGQYAN